MSFLIRDAVAARPPMAMSSTTGARTPSAPAQTAAARPAPTITVS